LDQAEPRHTVLALSGKPDGYYAPAVYQQPLTAGRMHARLSGSGSMAGVNLVIGAMTADLSGSGTITAAALTGIGNMTAAINVTGDTLTTANVGAALLAALIEGTLTFQDVQRILLSVSAGKTTIVAGPPVHAKFRDQADTKDRVDATMTGSERTAVTLDPS
jgi:peptidoglycan hydrolase-like protein with peptidoglycan-binding domain